MSYKPWNIYDYIYLYIKMLISRLNLIYLSFLFSISYLLYPALHFSGATPLCGVSVAGAFTQPPDLQHNNDEKESAIIFAFSFMLVGWLVVLRINVDLAIFQPYLDLEAGDNQSLKIQVARPGIEPRSSCSASQELNHLQSATAAPSVSCNFQKFSYIVTLIIMTACDLLTSTS